MIADRKTETAPSASTAGCRPTFINIGPGRCATSWLLEALKAHPQISMSRVKETEYFNTHPEKDHAWYEGHFDSGGDAVGEISSNYYLDADVAARIRDYAPDMRLIINLRNPYTLMNSFHGFGIRRGQELGPVEQSLELPVGQLMGSGFSARKKSGKLTASDSVTLLDSVLLADRLKPFFDTFDRDQIHFFIFEQLAVDWQQALTELYRFLGVDENFVPENADRVVNSAVQPKSKMVARLATGTASVLRAVGANAVLSQLHRSELLKKILFSKKQEEVGGGLRDRLPVEARQQIDQQIEQMKSLEPRLKDFWS